jgi:hypothetical protein
MNSMSARAPLHASPLSILPVRDGDPAPLTESAPTPSASSAEILRCAETLGIPWKRILLGEIESEQALRRYLPDVESEELLPSASTILPVSLLQSWRVRDRIQSLACQARGAAVRGAARQLRIVFQRLVGKADQDRAALAHHLWFAYQRVLLLQRVSRAAAKSRGPTAERLALICSRTRCCFDDAAWAVCQEGSPRRGDHLEAAVRKARDEGFLIPRAETEARSLMQLRRIVLASPHLARRPSPRRSPGRVGGPHRVSLPVDAI